MGEWSTITYVRSDDLGHVDRAFTALCAAEGLTPVPVPPPTTPSRAMRYGPGSDSPLWAVALIPGAGEWTMAMTTPIELLAERPPGAGRPRLADLAVLARCDAFTFNLYDGTSCVLAEANADGELACSGFPDNDDMSHHDERIPEEYGLTQFRLLTVSKALQDAAVVYPGAFEVIGELVTGRRHPEERHLMLYYNGVPDELLAFRDVPVPGARIRYYTRDRSAGVAEGEMSKPISGSSG
jgi:hypothetical protein